MASALALSAVTVVLCGSPSYAGYGENQTPTPGPAKSSSPGTIHSRVSYRTNYHGPGAQMTAPASSNWSPPSCWYEPEFTPEQFADYVNGNYRSAQSAFAQMAEEYGKGDFHKGDKGAWYQLTFSNDAIASSCAALDPWKWITPGQPATAETPTVDPKTLAGLAFNETILPKPNITLKPNGRNQLVNLDTEVTFAKALPRVWVTASLDNAAVGIHVAATTVAVPVKLTIDAGTPDADPRTCTYDLTRSGGTYSADTENSDCNVTYRRAGDYHLTASVVWKVTWTASANPDGPTSQPALPDGESTAPYATTVQEDEAVNR
jgi:enoyl reductase